MKVCREGWKSEVERLRGWKGGKVREVRRRRGEGQKAATIQKREK